MIFWFEETHYHDIHDIVSYSYQQCHRPQFSVPDSNLHSSMKPQVTSPRFLEFADPLHDWCVATWGPEYFQTIRLVSQQDHGMGIEFDDPYQAILFKLTWGGL